MFSEYLLPSVRFKLTVHDISESNLILLDNLADKFLKKWLHIPPPGTRAILHAPEGLNIKSFDHLYKESHAIAYASARIKADDSVNAALDRRLDHEVTWTRKASITVYSEHQYQTQTIDYSDICLNSVKSKVKKSINEEFHDTWINHIKSLVVQGQFLELLAIEKSSITWRSHIFNLPRGILQFAVNASIDTLCTNSNLKRWGKRTNALCGLCKQAKETLHHVLNNCPVMLDRYKLRHDSILNFLESVFNAIDNVDIFVDLPGKLKGISTVPPSLVVTSLRPDAVIINNSDKKVYLFELSVPFETNVNDTHLRKVKKYEQLIADIESKGFKTFYYPIEIGSRGYISKENSTRLKSLFHELKICNIKSVSKSLSSLALIGSFVIFHSKFEALWINPSYVTF